MRFLHFVLTNECNFQKLPQKEDYPKVCQFCYRQNVELETDPEKIKQIFQRIKEQTSLKEVILTGGDPLLSPYLDLVLGECVTAGLNSTVHTNGILLDSKYPILKGRVYGISIPLDSLDESTQAYFRGEGFLELTLSNIDLIKREGIALGINTFVSSRNLGQLCEIGDYLSSLDLRYWLLSQYRAINEKDKGNMEEYGSDTKQFRETINYLRSTFPQMCIFALESEQKSYPRRIWVQADGGVYADLSGQDQNLYLGNVLEMELGECIERMHTLKQQEVGD